MSLLTLPTELLLCISTSLGEKDLYSLVRTTRQLYSHIVDEMYRRNIQFQSGTGLAHAIKAKISDCT